MLHFIALVLSRMFFRKIIISGKPHEGNSALWIGNHSNGIVDPTVLLALSPVFLRPLAKATLWNNVVMKFFLKVTQAIPVARPQDASEMEETVGHHVGEEWVKAVNKKAFNSVHVALCEGAKVLIFPEGLSHDDPRMHSLKTGVARMAVDSSCDVAIQPVILDYSEKNEFRSELYIHYCDPIFIKKGVDSVDSIMESIKKIYAENFVQFESWDEKRNWYYLFKIYYGRIPNSLLEFRDFVNPMRESMNHDPVLFGKVHTMRCMLQANKIRPIERSWRRVVQNGEHPFWFVMFMLDILSFTFFKGPVLILYLLIWGIPFEACNRLGAVTKYNRDVYATMKIAHAMWIFPLWSCVTPGILTLAIYEYVPNIHMIFIWMIIFALLPVLLILGFYIDEDFKFFAGYFKYGVLKLTFPRALEEMLREWKNIANAVAQKVKQ